MFINQYCIIRHRSLISRGKVILGAAKGTLDDFLDEAFLQMSPGYSKFHKMDRLSKLGFLASEVVFRESPLFPYYAPEQVALVLSNSFSSTDTDLRFLDSIRTTPSPSLFVYTLPNIVAGEICIRQGIKGENAFFIFPEFDARNMADYVTQVMASEITTACLAGWIDVMDEHHDVFLYLVEKRKTALGIEHTADQLQKIYTHDHGTTSG